jgi:hypothetical protein
MNSTQVENEAVVDSTRGCTVDMKLEEERPGKKTRGPLCCLQPRAGV